MDFDWKLVTTPQDQDIDTQHDHADVRLCDPITEGEQCDATKLQLQCHSQPHTIENPDSLPPPDQQQCSRSGKGWHCLMMALPGKSLCDKHQLQNDIYNEEKRLRRPKRESRFSMDPILPSGQRQCRRAGDGGWRCPEMASPGIYCEKHQLEQDNHNSWRKYQRKMSKNSGVDGSNSDHLTSRKSICEHDRAKKIKAARLKSPKIIDDGELANIGVLESVGEAVKKRRGRERLKEKKIDSSDRVLELGERGMTKKRRGATVNGINGNWPTPQDQDIYTRHEHAESRRYSQIKGQEQDDSLKTQVQCQSNEELQMEADEDIMEVVTGLQSTGYVGDIRIPAELEQIYKEIKDRHGPLENGQSVDEKREFISYNARRATENGAPAEIFGNGLSD